MSILSKNELANECAKLTESDIEVLHNETTGLTYDVFTLADTHEPASGTADTGSIIETLNVIESASMAANYRHKINEVTPTITIGDSSTIHRPIQ